MHQGGCPNWIVLAEKANAATVVNAPLNERIAVTRQRLVIRVIRNLARQTKAARRIAVWTGVALDKNTMEHGVFGIVNPMLLRKLLATDPDMHAANRNIAQRRARLAHFRRCLVSRQSNKHRQRHRETTTRKGPPDDMPTYRDLHSEMAMSPA